MFDQNKNAYNQAAEQYLSERDQFENEKYLEELCNLLNPNSTILDIGCGAGKPVDTYLAERGHKIIGVDLSEKQIELAKQNLPEGNYSVRNMDELVIGEFSVDAVVSFYAIFHIPKEKHAELFKKINSFLTTGGLVLVTMGTSDWEGTDTLAGVEMAWSHYGKEQNEEIIKNAGFELLKSEIDTTGGENHLVVLARKS